MSKRAFERSIELMTAAHLTDAELAELPKLAKQLTPAQREKVMNAACAADDARAAERAARTQLEKTLQDVKAQARALLPDRGPCKGDNARRLGMFAAYADAVTGLSHLQRGSVARAGEHAARAWRRLERDKNRAIRDWRSKGGRHSKQYQREDLDLDARDNRIRSDYRKMTMPERNRASAIAFREELSVSQVRRILRKKARTG